MKQPSIAVSLFATILCLVAITGYQSFSSIRVLSFIDQNNDKVVDDWLPSVSWSKEMNVAKGDVNIAYQSHILATTDAEQAAAEKDIAQALDSFSKAREEYDKLIGEGDVEEKKMLADLDQQFADYKSKAAKMLDFSRKSQDEDAKKVIQEMAVHSRNMDDDLDRIIKINEVGAAKDGKENQDFLQYANNLAYLLAGIAILGGLAAIAFATTNITRPIKNITGAITKLAGGDTQSEIPYESRQDEIGTMAAALKVFRQAALTNKQLELAAEENRKQAEANRIADQARAEAEAAERMRIATSGLAAGLKRLAAGDLSFQLTEAFAADFEGLRKDFNVSVLQLGETLTSVAQSVVSITNGSTEISSGANDLSKRTEQQAAALEETAAALDQITANVTSSSKRAEEARNVAVQANLSATKSGEVVAQAVNAMSRIEASASQISNIIGVIDEIAFQTNLLALNAGVEAARAGEAGKGFAVVAQEVRELAQRSAGAAKEIKGLIQTSSAEVSTGVKLVSDTGDALKSIGEFIVNINDHMDAIATSSREQSTGLAEVNAAVNQMDQTTQQNAAMVEESSAAASSLSNDATSLRNLISQFELGQPRDQAQVLRQTAQKMGAATPTNIVQRQAPRRAAQGGVATPLEWSEF